MTWRRIIHSRDGWELVRRGRRLASVWWQPELAASSNCNRHWVYFINGQRVTYDGFEDKASAMREAERNMMGWVCAQFRIDGNVMAEVKCRAKPTRDGKRWYFIANDPNLDREYFTQIAEAYQAAEAYLWDRLLQSNPQIAEMTLKPERDRKRSADG